MSTVSWIEYLTLVVAAVVAVRGGSPSPAPHGRRLLWIGLLLTLQLAAFYGFVAIHFRTGWGIAETSPPGLAMLTQLVRLTLLLVAGRAWFGIVRSQLDKPWLRVSLVVCFILLCWPGTAWPAALWLFILFQRMKWFEALTGWRRALGFLGSVALLVALSLVPFTTVAGGKTQVVFAMTSGSWPPALLSGQVAAAAELALARPFDRVIQASIDVLRIQLLVLVFKFLFLPIRLSGMSLKRRFWFNFMLVRSIPSLLSGLVFVGLAYLAIGYTKAAQVRGAMEQTLARAATAANALADDRSIASAASPARLEHVRRWLAPDGDSAHIVMVGADSVVRATRGAPNSILDPPLSRIDTAVTRGLYVRGGHIFLATVRRASADTARDAGRSDLARTASGRSAGDSNLAGETLASAGTGAVTIEVWIPMDSAYLARTMRVVGGNARLTARPNVFVGRTSVRFGGDSSWTSRPIVVRHREPQAIAGLRRPWFLNRLFLPTGNWVGPTRDRWIGAIELYLDATPRSILRSTGRLLGGISSNAFLLLILAAVGLVVGMVEGFAVRSGKSIIQAVLDDVGKLRKAAEEFGAGRLDYRLPVEGKDEFGVVAASFNDMAANLERQRKELIVAERLEEDLAVARQIQQRLLPQQAPMLAGLDVAGVSIPSRAVGGDLFYWFTHDDGSLGFALGDVSGKSVPAALLMSNVLAALRSQAIDRLEPAAGLERTNRLIIEQIEPGRFVTLFYGEADPRRGTLRYASAGHHPAILLGASSGLAWLREGGVPLGVLPAASYRTESVSFAAGDTLIVYSDGVTEAEGRALVGSGGDSEREFYGEERLAEIAAALRGRPAREVLEGILASVQAFAAGVEQADDVTIVVVRRV